VNFNFKETRTNMGFVIKVCLYQCEYFNDDRYS